MTLEESREVIGILRSEYPQAFEGLTEKDIEARAETWQLRFRDESQHRVKTTLIGCMGRFGGRYGPTIGDVYRRLTDAIIPDELKLTENEAVQLVKKALRNGTYGYLSEYERLPQVIRETLGSASCLNEWSKLSENTLNSRVYPTFRRDFRDILEDAKEQYMGGVEDDETERNEP